MQTSLSNSSSLKSLFTKNTDKSKSQELTAKTEENLTTEPPVKGLKELVREEKKKFQDAINAKEGNNNTQELTAKSEENLPIEPVKGLKELVREEKKKFHDAINAKQQQEQQSNDMPKEISPPQKIESVKGLKELIREEKLKLKKEREQQENASKLNINNKSDEFETLSDLEQSENTTKRSEQKSELDQDHDGGVESEEEQEEEEEEEISEQVTEKKTENLEKTIKIQAKPTEPSQTSTVTTKEDENKKKSIFFGIFKSKSSNSLAKDAIKKLDQTVESSEPEEFKVTRKKKFYSKIYKYNFEFEFRKET